MDVQENGQVPRGHYIRVYIPNISGQVRRYKFLRFPFDINRIELLSQILYQESSIGTFINDT